MNEFKLTGVTAILIAATFLLSVFVCPVLAESSAVTVNFVPEDGFDKLKDLGGENNFGYWIEPDSSNILAINASAEGSQTVTAVNITTVNKSFGNSGMFDSNINYITTLAQAVRLGWSGVQNGNEFAAARLEGEPYENGSDLIEINIISGPAAGIDVAYEIELSGKASLASNGGRSISDYDTVDISEKVFRFWVLKKPVISGFKFFGENSAALSSPVYLYKNGNSYPVELIISDYLRDVHKISWSVSGEPFSVNPNDIRENSILVSGTGSGEITAGIDDIAGSSFSLPLVAEEWLRSVSDNRDFVGYSNGKDDSCWNFETPRNITYNVAPGLTNFNATKIAGDRTWDTEVTVAPLRGNESFGDVFGWWKGEPEVFVSESGKETAFEVDGENRLILLHSTTEDATAPDTEIVFTGYRLADMNKDDSVEITDAALVGMIVAQVIDDVSDENKIYADCNKALGDGDVDVADVLTVNRYIVGLVPWMSA